ncbi:thioredoxin family protein [Maribacter ulvicola]|uniref:Thiol-disulfide isomerase or thioredoxin n=1 Tax=Maribacter ulvicola TaxID=228959 RepID=A0A1N6WV77_9FLAO|nr:thioredoxin family protein [Maribacter ulvicola]SIQ94009.1 Thiol-disulfide isomerase or thioredoxin [Maribacter ulvicola]
MKFPVIIIILFLNYTVSTFSQNPNQEVTLENQQPFLLGEVTVDALSTNTYQSWYEQNFVNYEVDQNQIDVFKGKIASYKILIFMATWCADSKREVPRFLKILKSAGFPLENLKIVALDKRKVSYKKSPQGEEWGLNIRRVPTFIFYKNGKELNRIIETPVTTLEEDILKIISQHEYVPNYTSSLHFD